MSLSVSDRLGIEDVEIALDKDERSASWDCKSGRNRPFDSDQACTASEQLRSKLSDKIKKGDSPPSSQPSNSHLAGSFVPLKKNQGQKLMLAASEMATGPDQRNRISNFPAKTVGSATSNECSADERERKYSLSAADGNFKLKTPVPRSPGWDFIESKVGASHIFDYCNNGHSVAKFSPTTSGDSAAVDVKSMAVLEVKLAAHHRRKSFAHYDCMSALTNLADSEALDTAGKGAGSLSANVKSGASAARSLSNSEGRENFGDGKSNDMLLSTPHFKNELGADSTLCGLEGCPYLDYLTFLPVSCEGIVFEATPHECLEEEQLERQACSNVGIVRPQGGHQTKDVHPLRFSYMDHGALYYRLHFLEFEHQNYFGVDDNLGPVAISLRREAVEVQPDDTSLGSSNTLAVRYQYRIIVRTCHRKALRGCVLEESVVAACRGRSGESLRAKDIIAFVAPELQLSALHLAQSGSKVRDQLCRLDEQGVTRSYKIGVIYCAAEQNTEEEMYNNQEGSTLFSDFLEKCLGTKVALKGFEGYRGQLDNKQDANGTHSIYTKFRGNEVMFHVSTMLPFCKTNRQQLLRKRHIGNDIITVIFQDPGAKPFTPATIRSHFQHVFIVVKAHVEDGGKVCYRMAVSRADDIPLFEPILMADAKFEPGEAFRSFLLTKIINAEGAAHCSAKFRNLATRTRYEYLMDLASHWSTNQTVEESLGFWAKIRRRPAEKSHIGHRLCVQDLTTVPGAIGWHVQVINWGCGLEPTAVDGMLCISTLSICILDPETKMVRFHLPSSKITGWSPCSLPNTLRIFYHHGDFIVLRVSSREDALNELPEIMVRLSTVSNGCATHNVMLVRGQQGQLGFTIHTEGLVGEVDLDGSAWKSGLRPGARIVELDGVPIYGQTHEQVISQLKEAESLSAVIIPPNLDGTARSGRLSARQQRQKPLLRTSSLSPSPQLASRRQRFQQDQSVSPSSSSQQWNANDSDSDVKRATLMRRKDRQWGAVAQASRRTSQPTNAAHIDKNNPAFKGIVLKAKLALGTSNESAMGRKSPDATTSGQSASCLDVSSSGLDISESTLLPSSRFGGSQLIRDGDTLKLCLDNDDSSTLARGNLDRRFSLPEIAMSESMA